MENNKKNVVISDTDEQFRKCVELQAYGQDGTITADNLQLSGGEKKSCIVGSVDLKNLASANEVSPKNVDKYEVKLCGNVSGDVSGYTVYGIDGEAVATGEISLNENGEAEISIPVQQIEKATGSAEFGVELNGTGTMNVTKSYAAMSVTATSGSGASDIDYSFYCAVHILTPPDKTYYAIGEKFDKKGMVVALESGSGGYRYETSYYSIDKTGPLQITDKYVTISCGPFTVQQPIIVFDEKVYADNSSPSAEHGENLKVNLATGRLLYVNEDISVGANSYKISVSHVYNSKLYESLSGYFSGMPRGWKLDAHQCLISEGNKKYTYIDAVGYIHHFTVADYDHGIDEEGQGLILTVGSGKFIKDGQGNKLEFDSKGRLVKIISGKNSSIRKVYQYTDDKLTKIYDNRKTSVAIELVYKDGLLNGIHAVENGYYKKSVVFEYTASKLLQYKSVMSGTNKKRILTFSYFSSNKLIRTIAKNDSTQAYITYDKFRRVNKLASGYVSGSAFIEKASIDYDYLSLSEERSDYVYSNKITNDDGITLAYYFNNKGEVVSSFEKTSGGLVTLQREQGESISHTNGTTGINGISAKSVSGSALTLCSDEHELSTSIQYYALTLWVRHHWENTNARLKFTYDTVTGKNINTYTAYADIDGGAYGAWQNVTIPFNSHGAEKIKNLKLSVDKSGGTGSLNVSDYRITPASKSGILIDSDNIDLMDIQYIKLTGKSEQNIDCETKYRTEDYLTYNDIYRTLLNMAHNKEGDYFDFIYSNGTKLKSGVSRVELVDRWGDSYPLSLDASGNANVVAVNRSADNNSVTYNYVTFGANSITSTVKNKDGSDNLLSKTEQVASYNGNVISETDEYGVRKDYSYNNYGDLRSVTLTGTDGKIITLQNNVYDGNNEYVTQTSSGYNSENFSYVKPFEVLDKYNINLYNDSSKTYEETRTGVKYTYDTYGENLTGIAATDGSNRVALHRISYINGEVSAVSDEVTKYYFENNKADGTYIFGVYEKYDRVPLQSTVMTDNSETRIFYRNKAAKSDEFTTCYDKYGRVISESYNGEVKAEFFYEDNKESSLISGIKAINDYYSDSTYEYAYDDSGALKRLTQTLPTGELLEIEKPNAVQSNYAFSDGWNYSTIVEYNQSSTRIKSTNIVRNEEKLPYVSKNYGYDNFGRLKEVKSSYSYRREIPSYSSGSATSITENKSASMNYQYQDSNVGSLISQIEYTQKTNSSIISSVSTFGKSSTKFTSKYSYDARGNIKEIIESGSASGEDTVGGKTTSNTYMPDYCGTVQYVYDNFNRLTSEINSQMGITCNYDYEDGRLKTVKINGAMRYYHYDLRGRLEKICADSAGKEVINQYHYDNYGNRTGIGSESAMTVSYRWERGRLLTGLSKLKACECAYKYNYAGLRVEKTENGVTTNYYYEGNKLIGEDRSDGTTIRYFYDAQGICGFLYNNKLYSYVKDIFGNVVMIMDDTRPVARYSYDAWGNHKVLDAKGTEIWVSNFIGNINPIRYRSYYYDTEGGLYYLQTRYYDSTIGMFISPDCVDYIEPEEIGGINLYAYCLNNPVMMIDPMGCAPEWLKWLGIGLAVVGAVLVIGAVTVLTCGVGTLAGTMAGAVIYGAAQGIVIGAAVGVVAGGIVGGIATDWSAEGILIGMGIGLGAGAILGGVIGGVAGGSSFTANSAYISQYGGNVKEVFSAFKGNPRLKVLNSNTTVYRTWGGASSKFGHWISPKNYGSAARRMLSLPPWNTATNTSSFLISKGSTVLSGKAAALFGQAGGGIQWWIGVL